MPSQAGNNMAQGLRVVLAGAGVSAAPPSGLPGWNDTQAAVVRVLAERLDAALGGASGIQPWVAGIDAERRSDRFTPDYQAQLIEEMCGDRYFRALQALDVAATNAGHEAIAALAATGALRAMVTTNFDRLIERALERRGVRFEVALDDAGFAALQARLAKATAGPLPILKIHGCVSDHRSMIDTLKQRKRGRSQHLQACINALLPLHWLYLGFSAADLEAEPDYLGLVPGAARSAGATFVAFPGAPTLGAGARRLMNAYGDKGEVVVAQVPEVLDQLCSAWGGSASMVGDAAAGESASAVAGTAGVAGAVAGAVAAEEAAAGSAAPPPGREQFERQLRDWAQSLSPAATGLCLAALLEATGQAEAAMRLLDRLVRKERLPDRDSDDFRALQLHHGRLGAAWGRFIAVPDLNGAASNASVETAQSLMRLQDTPQGFAASAWLACLSLWLGDGQRATGLALGLLQGLVSNQWPGSPPRSDEEVVDAWLSAAQVLVVNAHAQTIGLVDATAPGALARAVGCGDPVRAARVVALHGLALGSTTEDVPALLQRHAGHFADATRVGDGFALGMRALALGRWGVGPGRAADNAHAHQALADLATALHHFERQGMDPWCLMVQVQQAKAHADLQDFDAAQTCIDQAAAGLNRFAVLASHLHEAVGQIRSMWGDTQAGDSFEAAIAAAEDSGLLARREALLALRSPAT